MVFRHRCNANVMLFEMQLAMDYWWSLELVLLEKFWLDWKIKKKKKLYEILHVIWARFGNMYPENSEHWVPRSEPWNFEPRIDWTSQRIKPHYKLGVKVWNMKMDFNTEGTWRRVGQWTLMMKIYDFFIRLSRYQAIHNSM